MIPDDSLVRNVDHTAGRATLGAEPRRHDLLGEPIVRLIVASAREETKILPGSLVSWGLVIGLRCVQRHRELGRLLPIIGELLGNVA